MEEVPAALDVSNAALPEQVQDVHLPDGDVTQALHGIGIPQHGVDAGTAFQLVVTDLVVDLLKIVLLQNHRDDGAEDFGLLFVIGSPGQDIGAGKIVHGIGVLVGDAVKEPGGAGFHCLLGAGAHTLPVAQLEPLLVFNDPLL